MRMVRGLFVVAVVMLSWCAVVRAEQPQGQVTILNDAFGRWPKLKLDWGYAALIEWGGRRILFDAGDDVALLQENAAAMKVDLTHLDMIVISDVEPEHWSGLRWILAQNPKAQLFVPDDVTFRGRELPQEILMGDKEPTLPPEQRYFNGYAPDHIPEWRGYSDVRLTAVRSSVSVAQGVRLVATMSRREPDKGRLELALVLETAKGPVVFVGCAHAGIENVMAAVMEGSAHPQTWMLVGGLHLIESSAVEIDRALDTLQTTYRVQRMAAGHCTGERAFLKIHERWKKDDVYAGLGEVVEF